MVLPTIILRRRRAANAKTVRTTAVLFLHPIWDSESERLGKRECTRAGYNLHVLSELIGFFGGLFLLVVVGYLAYRGVSGTFTISLLWLLAYPLAVGIVSQGLFALSWHLAYRKDFKYDAETMRATWIEAGKPLSYKWDPES